MREIQKEENQSNDVVTRKNRTPVFVIVISLLLIVIFFFYYQNQQLEAERLRQQQEISDTYLVLDSVSNELDIRIEEIKVLGGDVDTLQILKAQLETDKKQLLVDAAYQRGRIQKLNDRVDGYKELLLIKDKEIEQLKILNDELSEENTTLKVEKNKLNVSIQKLQKDTKELQQKVAQASRLEISAFKVIAINDRGKERDNGEYRNRHIKQLKIQFTVLENEIAPIEGKELLIRILAPDGNILFDVTRGSGSFTFNKRELFYTAREEILYDRNSQLVSFLYEKGSEYAIGQYTVEVYTDDYMMGTGSFIVK